MPAPSSPPIMACSVACSALARTALDSGWSLCTTETTNATRPPNVHTAAPRTVSPSAFMTDSTSDRSPTRSRPSSSTTVLELRSSSASGIGCACCACCWALSGDSTRWIAASLLASLTFPPLSVTSNWSRNQPPSDEMRALGTLSPSSVRHCTSSTSVPGRLAESSVTMVLCSCVWLSMSTLGGWMRSSSVSYSSSTPASETDDWLALAPS
mmetsp:Transcript_3708/g.10458  ORF Transcript_3708/g.10458 Transcript_3708/m.10458 type:complete len:211 (+) Transcript_3708:204-836(+)